MSDSAISLPPHPGLTQGERLVDTFFAPRKTFTDILRDQSWWLPFLLLVLVTLLSSYAMDKKVGFDAISEQQMTKSASGAERMQNMAADQRAHAIKMSAAITKGVSYGSFLLILLFVAIEALVLWGCFNFGLGAKTTFPQVFAVIMYAGLPRAFVSLLTTILLFSGVGTDGFDIQHPVGTNLGYYMTSPVMKAAGGFLDIFGIWSLILLIIGMAVISRKSVGQSAAIIGGLWFIGLLIAVGIAAAFG